MSLVTIATIAISVAFALTMFAAARYFVNIPPAGRNLYTLAVIMVLVVWLCGHFGIIWGSSVDILTVSLIASVYLGLILGTVLPGRAPQADRLERAFGDRICDVEDSLANALKKSFPQASNCAFSTIQEPLDNLFGLRKEILAAMPRAGTWVSNLDRQALEDWLGEHPLIDYRRTIVEAARTLVYTELDTYHKSLNCSLNPTAPMLIESLRALKQQTLVHSPLAVLPESSASDAHLPGGDLRQSFAILVLSCALSSMGRTQIVQPAINESAFCAIALRYAKNALAARELADDVIIYCKGHDSQPFIIKPKPNTGTEAASS